MKFNDINFSKQHRFSIGIEETTGKYYLSIPVTTSRFADYEEYYEISSEEFATFSSNLDGAIDLVKRCRERKEDSRLMIKPDKNRGNPC
jgi:hypothetical protein